VALTLKKSGSTADTPPGQPVTERLAAFICESSWSKLPQSARAATRRSLLNIVGAGLGGSREFLVQRLVSALRPFGGPPQAVVIGRTEMFDRLTASFINAVAANALDFDDTHFPSVIHPSAPVFAPVLALSEQNRVSGTELLGALAVGLEIACRMGVAATPDYYRRGAHVTATCGVIGAAAACARLLGLDRQRVIWALGIAATRAAGLVENLGSMAKSVGVGGAARDGLMAALLAQAGIDASPRAIEGPGGFLALASNKSMPEALVDQLGQRFELENNQFKPYPAAIVLSPVIDAALDVAGHRDFDIHTVKSIHVSGHPLLLERADRPNVNTGVEAKLSLQHSVAWALLERSVGVEAYTDEAVTKVAVRALRAKVSAMADPRHSLESCVVETTLMSGKVVRIVVDAARGGPARPLSDEELSQKFMRLARWGAPGVKADRVLEALKSLEHMQDIRPILRMTVPVNG
jgi:2-methylcitrate dehydratase PrpD